MIHCIFLIDDLSLMFSVYLFFIIQFTAKLKLMQGLISAFILTEKCIISSSSYLLLYPVYFELQVAMLP